MSDYLLSMATDLAIWQPRSATAASTGALDRPKREPRSRSDRVTADSMSAMGICDQRWDECTRELLELRRLKRNWNGFDADPPDPAAVDSAINLLSQLRLRQKDAPPSRVVLGPDGAVIIEWQTDIERVEVEICSPLRAEWMRSRRGQPATHWDENLPSFAGDVTWESEADSVAADAASDYEL